MEKTIIYFIFFTLCVSSSVYGQDQDTVKKSKAFNKAVYSEARKATIMSACLPGLGQIYNGKKAFWKVPLIYVALGGISYYGISNQIKYKYYSNNLRYIYDNDSNTVNATFYGTDQLISEKRFYKKNRDIAILLGAVVYLMNIIDANVEAHLKTFDVSDDLSLQIKPYSTFGYDNKLQTGITLKLKFK